MIFVLLVKLFVLSICIGYLFQKLKDESRTRYDRIVAALKDIYNDIPESDRNGYNVVVSGHSLGGALANLFAFTLALREDEESCPLFHYVQAVTFAGPVVGNSGYNEVFEVSCFTIKELKDCIYFTKYSKSINPPRSLKEKRSST